MELSHVAEMSDMNPAAREASICEQTGRKASLIKQDKDPDTE